jgi:lytic starch monooxygenase
MYDIYKFNPWRAPGHAPVLDACGMAGGTPVDLQAEYGVAGCQRTGCWYTETEFASHGDLGSEVTLGRGGLAGPGSEVTLGRLESRT